MDNPLHNSSPSNTGTYLVIIVGIVAAIALVLGVISLKRVSSLSDKIGEVAVADIAAQVDRIDQRVKTTSETATRVQQNLTSLQTTTQRAFDDVASEYSDIRTSLNKLTTDTQTVVDRMGELEARGLLRPSSASAGGAGSAGAAPGTLSGEGTYIIKSGDTLGSIGRQFGIPWQQIAAANPGIDPNRLRIGQAIAIPKRD